MNNRISGVAALTILLSGAANGLEDPAKPGACLDIASDYNAFIKEDFTAQSTDAQGSIAVGGNFTVQNYGLASAISLSSDTYSLIAGGVVSFQNGQVYAGSVLTGGVETENTFQSFNLLDPAATVDSGAVSPIDFEAEFFELTEFSQSLTTLPVNGTLDYFSWGGLYLQGDCASETQVFNLDGEQLQSAVVFSLDCVPADATVIFNIDGDDVGMQNMGLHSLAGRAGQILFNFYEAENLTLANIGIEGSILAPNADADTSWGYVNGTVVTKSWTGPMELHNVPFSGCVGIPQNLPTVIGNTNPPTVAVVGELYEYDLQATDGDGDFINYGLLAFPEASGLSISLDGVVSWIPQAGDVGEYEIFVIAQDDFGGRDFIEYLLIVED